MFFFLCNTTNRTQPPESLEHAWCWQGSWVVGRISTALILQSVFPKSHLSEHRLSGTRPAAMITWATMIPSSWRDLLEENSKSTATAWSSLCSGTKSSTWSRQTSSLMISSGGRSLWMHLNSTSSLLSLWKLLSTTELENTGLRATIWCEGGRGDSIFLTNGGRTEMSMKIKNVVTRRRGHALRGWRRIHASGLGWRRQENGQ